ncbi:hypothetical protein [Ochrobactrum sp. CGA5]|uniref:hypothetical protein n=1 Tax=Ochrobactrum sp. CGA5 TaxID=2583453 RepID=UPI00112397FD|nr:hypothetical protein [Ochrobactrum sp. CGA5]
MFSLTQLFGNQNFASPVLRSEPNIDWITNVLAFQISDLSCVNKDVAVPISKMHEASGGSSTEMMQTMHKVSLCWVSARR